MNTLSEVAVDKEGNQVELNKWIEDEGNERTMYVRTKDIAICTDHTFNKQHICTHCPYMFVGFSANRHIQTNKGIFERLPQNKIGKKIA